MPGEMPPEKDSKKEKFKKGIPAVINRLIIKTA
jgi:hypothetical protein